MEVFTPRLTTTFTPPASCLGPKFTLSPHGPDTVEESWQSDYILELTRGLRAECYPPYFALFSDEVSVNGSGFTKTPIDFYSPGICPQSYAAASQEVDSTSQTTTTCCPEYVKALCVRSKT